MNNIKFNLLTGLIICASLFFIGCDDYLDKMPDDKVSESEVFTRYEMVDRLVTDLYAGAKNANKPLIYFSHFGTAAVTDECSASSHEAAIP
ncbi:MAG: RagB/SusD family nutrient uptake outer membrane protein, partial [Tannerella sp.]|nr:RagB/SusD family nutrient uptake outer membrane protein [Tannerella sp.]